MSLRNFIAFYLFLAALLGMATAGMVSCSCGSDNDNATVVHIVGSDECTADKCASFLQFMDDCGITCLDTDDEPVSCTAYQDFCVACTEDWACSITNCHPDTDESMTCNDLSNCIADEC